MNKTREEEEKKNDFLLMPKSINTSKNILHCGTYYSIVLVALNN